MRCWHFPWLKEALCINLGKQLPTWTNLISFLSRMEGARVEHRQMAKSNNPQFYKMFWYGIEFNNFYDFQNWRASKLSSDLRRDDVHFFPLHFSKTRILKVRCCKSKWSILAWSRNTKKVVRLFFRFIGRKLIINLPLPHRGSRIIIYIISMMLSYIFILQERPTAVRERIVKIYFCGHLWIVWQLLMSENREVGTQEHCNLPVN